MVRSIHKHAENLALQCYSHEVSDNYLSAKIVIKETRRQLVMDAANAICESLTPPLQQVVDLASTGDGSLQLVYCPSNGRGQLHCAQIRFSRCHGSETWLGSFTHSFPLFVVKPPLCNMLFCF